MENLGILGGSNFSFLHSLETYGKQGTSSWHYMEFHGIVRSYCMPCEIEGRAGFESVQKFSDIQVQAKIG